MSLGEESKAVRRYVDAFNQGDRAALKALLAEDLSWLRWVNRSLKPLKKIGEA